MKNILVTVLLLLTPVIYAENVYTVKTVPNDQLFNSRDYVTNPDNIISSGAESRINNLIQSVKDSTSAEIAVVLLNSIGTEDIDNFATELFTTWGIGKKNDNGLLFLLVYDVREMVFRTGYGLEGVLPDVILDRIIRNDITPGLRNGDFDGGITAGMDHVGYYLTNPEAANEIMYSNANQGDTENFKSIFTTYLVICFAVFLAFLFYFIFLYFSRKENYLKYKKLDNGSFKFLLTLSTLFFPIFMIIAVILYFISKKAIRNKPKKCSRCQHKMRRLNENEDDQYLDKGQQTEEKLKSIDYDVWLCGNCKNVDILRYDVKLSTYSLCPNCHYKTYAQSSDRIISRATALSSGVGEREYSCWNCGIKNIKKYTIPMIIAASGGAFSGRGRGPFGGGGFGGGSFGGGSWGGGRTGGGGARGGW